jgi:D-glycero-alpha-D-manno-heptose-7-phosphate kinase
MIVSQTPLRVSLFGGGTDIRSFYRIQGGAVLSTSIDKYVYVIAKKRFDANIRVAYTRTENVSSVAEIRHDLVREAMRVVGIRNGIEIVTLADIPSEGTGLGSSSTVTVGLLNALYGFTGISVGAEQLAREACYIETEILGAPIGKQDQYIAAYGGLRVFEFHPDERVTAEEVALDDSTRQDLAARFLLFYTGITRSASEILQDQQKNMLSRMEVLQQMKRQVWEAVEMIDARNFDAVGHLLDQAWEWKQQLSEYISSPSLDAMYQRAKQHGALGGKITGAGGGGFLLLYCLPAHQGAVREALREYKELPFHFSRFGSRIVFNIQ